MQQMKKVFQTIKKKLKLWKKKFLCKQLAKKETLQIWVFQQKISWNIYILKFCLQQQRKTKELALWRTQSFLVWYAIEKKEVNNFFFISPVFLRTKTDNYLHHLLYQLVSKRHLLIILHPIFFRVITYSFFLRMHSEEIKMTKIKGVQAVLQHLVIFEAGDT